jgi:4-amino-4-deoxy-L-arabinose transferase-like glycosyltransferase
MTKQLRQPAVPQTSLFPFFPEAVNHARAGLAIAVLFFIVMVFIGLKYHIVGDYGVETDFYWSYVPEARHILEGTIPIEDFRGPGYPLVLACIALFTSDLFHAGVVLSTLSAAASLFFIFQILKHLFRADIALIGTLLVAVNTTFVQYSYSAGTDMFFVALVTASTFFFLRDEQMRWLNIVLSALLAGLAYLTRYNGLFAAVAAPLAILAVNPFQQTRKIRAKTAAVYLGIFMLTIAPWGIYCLIEKGSFFYNKNYLNIAYEMFAKGKITWDQYWSVDAQRFTSLTQVIFANPGLFLGTVVRNIFEHGVGDLGKLLGWQTGIFSLLGIPLFVKERPHAQLLSFFVFALMFFAVLLLVFYGERFSMYLLPVYVIFALKTLTWQRLARYRFWKRVQSGALIGIVLLVWTAISSYEFNSANIDSGPREVVSIAQWFRNNYDDTAKGQIIIARKPHIAYYLDMKMELFPYVDTYPQLLDQIRKVHASYLYFSLMEAGMRPQFQYLLDPSKAPPELKALTYSSYPPAVLYKVQPGPKP